MPDKRQYSPDTQIFDNSFLSDATTTTYGVDATFMFILIISIFFTLLITGLMIYFVFKYNRKKHDTVENIHGHTALELTWTIVPTIIVLIMFWVSWDTYAVSRDKPKCSDEKVVCIDVTAYQFGWQYDYKNANGEKVHQSKWGL